MSNQLNGIKKSLTVARDRVRQLNQENLKLKKQLMNNIKSDFPTNTKIQELANNSYQMNGRPASILTAIAWDNYPSEAFDTLVKNLGEINPEIASEVSEYGVCFTVLKEGEHFCASGFINTDSIAIDLEEWYADLPMNSKAVVLWYRDCDDSEKLRGAIDQYACDLIEEIKDFLSDNGIEEDELDQYLLDGDICEGLIFIESVEEDIIVTDRGCLGWRSDDETEWEFINKNRGNLIGISQIVNPEKLFDLQGGTIFVIE